jgi:hypothetical protein
MQLYNTFANYLSVLCNIIQLPTRRNEKLSQTFKAELKEAAFSQPICEHCQVNPKATKPYIKRLDIGMDDLTEKVLKGVSEKTGVPKECVMCISFMRFMELSKEDQLQLLKAEYEWRKKQGLA